MKRQVVMSLVLCCAAIGVCTVPAYATTRDRVTAATTIRNYLDGLGTQRSLASSTAGSPARVLATHTLAIADALVANRQRRTIESTRFSRGQALICPRGTTRSPTCSTLTGFVTDPATGRVVTFMVNSVPLTSRLATRTGQPIPITGTAGTLGLVGLSSAYQTGPGQLVIIADFVGLAQPVGASRAILTVSEDQIRYRRPDGQQVAADSLLNQRAPRNPSLKVKSPRNVLRIVLFFHNQGLGGQLIVPTTGRPQTASLVGSGQLPIG